MKILLAFFIWCLFTLILVCSIIGLVILLPEPNYSEYRIPQEESRSTWMRIGIDLKDKLLDKL